MSLRFGKPRLRETEDVEFRGFGKETFQFEVFGSKALSVQVEDTETREESTFI